MKKIYSLALAITLFLTFSACQQELHFPEPEPVSQLTVLVDGVQYTLTVKEKLSYNAGDTAHVELLATSPEISVRLVAKSPQHSNGVGEYFLWCCNNDVFDRTTGTQQHFETNRASGNKQQGFVKISKWDDKSIEGSFSMTGKVGTSNTAPQKTFTGSFILIL